jgi:alpha-glucosidase (family GH31 glycosyl hydrolase)
VIRHRPEGRGHPYLIEPDARVPLRPVAGRTFQVRATTQSTVERVQAELGDGQLIEASLRGDAVPDVESVWGRTAQRAGDGHLTDAVARLGEREGRVSWAAELPAERLRYRFLAQGQQTRWFEITPSTWSAHGGTLRVAGDSVRLVDGSLEWLSDGESSYRLRFALRLHPGERVVGFGERFDALDQRGRRVDTAVFDQYKGQGARSYMPMPFAIVVGGGFGFHVDTGRRCWFDVGATDPDILSVEVDLEPGERDPTIELRFFSGPPAEVLRAFASAPADPPPEWIYALWMSGNEWNSQARVMEEVEASLQRGIDPGVVVIEAWSDEETFVAFNDAQYDPHPDGAPHSLADFSFPPDGRWPDPKGMVDDLHARGIKVLLWQIPLVQASRGQAGHDRRTMIERGYCVRRRDGEPYRNRGWWFPGALLPDFTNPEATDWWLAKRRYLVKEVGVDGFKTDGGEHAWGSDLRYADGTRGGETNNRYPVLYGHAYHHLAPVTFSRAGFTGSGAIPCHWAGDQDSTWEAFRASLTAGLTAGASGIFFWGWDLAGFSGELPSAELYLRSAAAAALSPIMQYHSEFNHHRLPSRDRTPWNVAAQTGEPEVVTLFRHFVQLRKRLRPYLIDAGRAAVTERVPLMRALFFDHPDEEAAWDFPYQYMLGDALLVSPVCREGAPSWQTYLPDGDWVDAWTGDRLDGNRIVERPAPINEIPLYITATRAGELLPLVRPLELMEVS